MTDQFKVGDRVIYEGTEYNALKGKKGTIVESTIENNYAIEFDEHIGFHDCDGHTKIGHGFWCVKNRYNKLVPDKILNWKKELKK